VKLDVVDDAAVTMQLAELCAAFARPDPYGGIAARGGEQGAIRREGDPVAIAAVALEHATDAPFRRVPQAHRAIRARGREPAPVPAGVEPVHGTLVRLRWARAQGGVGARQPHGGVQPPLTSRVPSELKRAA